jgi:hypothetical protein
MFAIDEIGRISIKEGYDKPCALFELPLDPSKADRTPSATFFLKTVRSITVNLVTELRMEIGNMTILRDVRNFSAYFSDSLTQKPTV